MDRLSVVEREELWDLWEAGESQRSISRRLGRRRQWISTRQNWEVRILVKVGAGSCRAES